MIRNTSEPEKKVLLLQEDAPWASRQAPLLSAMSVSMVDTFQSTRREQDRPASAEVKINASIHGKATFVTMP